MRTQFDVQPNVNRLLNHVGLTDDWIGAVIDCVFERPSVIAERLMDLAQPTCKVCGDPYSAHQHYRSGTDCAKCPSAQYRATTTRTQ